MRKLGVIRSEAHGSLSRGTYTRLIKAIAAQGPWSMVLQAFNDPESQTRAEGGDPQNTSMGPKPSQRPRAQSCGFLSISLPVEEERKTLLCPSLTQTPVADRPKVLQSMCRPELRNQWPWQAHCGLNKESARTRHVPSYLNT